MKPKDAEDADAANMIMPALLLTVCPGGFEKSGDRGGGVASN